MFNNLKPLSDNKEIRYFPLNQVETSKVVRTIQIVFGFVCIAIAFYWMIFNIRSSSATGTIWVTIAFLSGFGFYQVWSGIGQAIRFIEIGKGKVRLKKTILLPAIEMDADGITKIEIFPFNFSFYLKSGKKIILRLSSTFYETNAMIKDEILNFSDENNIECELVEEKI